MVNSKYVRGMAAALALAGLSSTAMGDCIFTPAQDISVYSSHWSAVVFYNYTSTATTVAGPTFGSFEAAYTATPGQWEGAFLYDYARGSFSYASYSYLEPLGPPPPPPPQ